MKLRTGYFYQVEEWDGTLNVVQLTVRRDGVNMTYPDGITHNVSRAYFQSIARQPFGPINPAQLQLCKPREGDLWN